MAHMIIEAFYFHNSNLNLLRLDTWKILIDLSETTRLQDDIISEKYMHAKLLAALCVAIPLSAASAAEPIEVVEGGTPSANAVTIESMSFNAPEMKIKVGDSVTWTNKDEIAHNVHFRQGPAKGHAKAQGKMLTQGNTYTVKFTTAGEYNYVCTPHPPMKGKVIVE